MLTIATVGAYCVYPRQDYNPADLPAEYHPAVLAYFERAAYRDLAREILTPSKGAERIRTAKQRQGIAERAAEAASEAYVFWLTNRTKRIPRGAHISAMAGVRRFMERSGWKGRTGQRRAANRKQVEGMLARREAARERAGYTPESVAVAVERIANSPALGRKAYRLAKRLGLPGVRELVREACGFAAN